MSSSGTTPRAPRPAQSDFARPHTLCHFCPALFLAPSNIRYADYEHWQSLRFVRTCRTNQHGLHVAGLSLRTRGQFAVHVNLMLRFTHNAVGPRTSHAAQACTQRGLMRTSTLGTKHDVRSETTGWCTTGLALATHCHARHRNRLATWSGSSYFALRGHLPGWKQGPPGGPRLWTTIWSQRFGHAQCVTEALGPNSRLVLGTKRWFAYPARSSSSGPCGM